MSVRSAPLALVLAVTSCTFGDHHGGRPRDAGTNPDPDASDGAVALYTRSEVVASIATNVILETVRDLEAAAIELETATAAFAAAPSDTALRDAARAEWRDFMHVWQRALIYQVGPLGSPTETLGGLSIRDQIDSWPLLNRCGIDEYTADSTYTNVATLAAGPVNRRGVVALEYLLFDTTTAHHCTSTFDATWSGVADLAARRAGYAASIASIVHTRATELRNAWEPSGGNFVGNFTGSGMLYADANDALNALSDALFYFDLTTKDAKVGIPTGLDALCGSATCPDSVESRYAGASLAHVRDNLLGFRAVVVGGEVGNESAPGFDDLLIGIGQGGVSATLVAEIDQAIATIDGLTQTLEWLVVNDWPTAKLIYDELKGVSDLLKTQFVGLLDLTVPATAAGDND